MIRSLVAGVCALSLLFSACQSGPPEIPYPAFVSVDELPDMFLAGLPGVRAKPLVGAGGDKVGGGYRIDLPSSWSGTSGASPDKTLEIFVIEGSLNVADISLQRGGYAYLPPGTLGFNLKSPTGARVLYFLDDIDPNAVIKTPLIMESTVLDWDDTDVDGMSTKELRFDPGTGARSWLLRIEPGAQVPWQSSSVTREGYFMVGNYTHTECVAGEPNTNVYLPGGYFYRPGNAINGGPEAAATTTSVWFLRELGKGTVTTHESCNSTVTGY